MALFEEMGEMLTGGSNLGALSSFLGSDDEKTSGLLGMAGPALLGALGKRSASPAGAEALFGLANGADDSILDNLGGFLGGGDSGGVGGALLGSLLGSKRGAVESGLAQQSGMGGAIVSKLLPMLAPMVMGFLKRKIMGGGMNASSMASMLGDNTNAMRGGGLGSILDLLDGDDDDDEAGFLDGIKNLPGLGSLGGATAAMGAAAGMAGKAGDMASGITGKATGAVGDVAGKAGDMASGVTGKVSDASLPDVGGSGGGMMKFLLPLLGLLALLAILFFACGGSDSGSETAATGTSTGECGTTNRVVRPSSPVTDLSVALVAPSSAEDLAFTQSMVDALARLGIDPQITDGTFIVEEAAAAIRGYAEDGVDVVIAHGTQYGGSLAEIAPDFPETSFIWGTAQDTQGLANVFAYYPEAQEGGYVNGWLAAEIVGGGSHGVVGPVEAGDAVAYINGFEAGANANGASNVAITYTGSFSDVALATEAAQAHLTTGVDTLTGTSQSTVGAVNVAAQEDVPWFGTQSNQEAWSEDLVVASQVYHWEVILDDMFEMIEDGTLGGEAMALTLENGGLLIELNGCYSIDDTAIDGVQGVIDDIIAGNITPPA